MPYVSRARLSLTCLVTAALLIGAAPPAAAETHSAVGPPQAAAPTRGGALVATMRSEPRSFNPHAGRDFASTTLALLTHGRLVRVNRATQAIEPALAESFTCAADARSCTLKLRPQVTWSDGTPFTVADVLFSFQALFDEKTGSWMVDDFMPGGKPVVVTAPDARTIVVTFAVPYGPGVRVLDKLPMLPKHKLEGALKAGTLRQQWGTSTPPGDLVGLGPFQVNEYRPGERLVLARNPRYWRKDAAGVQLPYLDRLTIEICPDQNTELLRLQSGQADLTQTEIRADDYAVLKRQATAGKLALIDAGVALDADAFWFNLKPAAKANDPRRVWLQSLELRKAVSHAVDRRAFADAVFLGAAEPQWGPVTPANKTWFAPAGVVERHAFDRAKAKQLLAAVGLRDTNNDGLVEDASGQPARFTLITQKGNTALEKGAAVLRDELKTVGLTMEVVPLEVGALVDRLQKADYDAIYYRFLNTDTDPSGAMDFWLSSGGAHVWHLDQPTPATTWEKAIDAAMQRMVATGDLAARQKAFNEAQKLLSDNLPVVYFAAARLYVAVGTRVVGAVPAPLRPTVLWNAESLRAK